MNNVNLLKKSQTRNLRKSLQGKVIRVGDKTIMVAVETAYKHKIYAKRFRKTKKFATYDKNGLAKVGDFVKITECRPISKTKHFRLVEVLQKKGEI
ncbi:30S ribosomal protein S17 [Mycoplasma flocculare]|uniref:Small ribosomal subunit protein uS17 n=2 Tax=Mesomycoplasma flocculare TaxID=2128 RepID=A0A0A8ECS3_MESFC|nr:30S ribosomal protein S17 [Mesomycoplasma flocculare]MXR39462.1 30S ribosomal protein S17 [Mycoplasma sp. MF12]AJC49991.1 30S ribosomal protein S17 [Mesomycoplasma flocculare ATCC 27399]MXR05871.1 30S ribosomal protein S17 [Mesomycoplasma flocculare]MXR12283.1 30S ribosomal protein S17 [Mesomycoplasma flocculare]MXR13498.1 30S ribosomal protein S17 [Mesomycoplasma flocculare]